MIANGRGSVCLAGAASMKHRVPAVVRLPLLDIAQWNEQQPFKLLGHGFDSHYPTLLSDKQVQPTQ
jgi:hypothetical protein